MNDTLGKLKINLGSGKSAPYNQDYLNVDVADTLIGEKVIKPDLLCDMTLLEFPDESFTEVKAWDCLDHIEYIQCLGMIRKIKAWLKPNGILDIHLPNLRSLAGVLAVKDVHHALVWMYGTDGEENYYPSNKIRWSYSKEAIINILEKNGFQIMQFLDDCDGYAFRIIVVKK